MELLRTGQRSTRALLRARTRVRHAEVEARHWTGAGFADRRAYMAFLRAMATAHCRLGMPAARMRADPAGVAHEQAALAQLSLDLGQAFGPPARTVDGGTAYAWGVGYVLLGSALGAKSILSSCSLERSWPRRYLRFMQAQLRNGNVYEFFQALDTTAPAIEEAARGADAVFELLLRAEMRPLVN